MSMSSPPAQPRGGTGGGGGLTALKLLSVKGAAQLRLQQDELLQPDDAIFFAPSSRPPLVTVGVGVSGIVGTAASKHGGGGASPMTLGGAALLSVGIVVAAGEFELVVHELLRPNPLQYAPCAWCPNPNTLFSTGVNRIIPRSAVIGRALIKLRAGALAFADGGADENAAPQAAFKDRPFDLADARSAVPSSAASAVVWMQLEELQARVTNTEQATHKFASSTKMLGEELCKLEKDVQQMLFRYDQETRALIGDRDQFMLGKIASLARVVDALKAEAHDERQKDKTVAAAAQSEAELRLDNVERTVGRINELSASASNDVAHRIAALEAELELATQHADTLGNEVAGLAKHVGRRMVQFGRQLTDLREEFDALSLGGSSGGGGGGAGSKRAATGQLVPHVRGRALAAAALGGEGDTFPQAAAPESARAERQSPTGRRSAGGSFPSLAPRSTRMPTHERPPTALSGGMSSIPSAICAPSAPASGGGAKCSVSTTVYLSTPRQRPPAWPWWRRRAPATSGRFERFFDDVEAAVPRNSSGPAAALVYNLDLWRMLPVLGTTQLETLLAAGKGAWAWTGQAPAAPAASEAAAEAAVSQAQLEERLARLLDARFRELEVRLDRDEGNGIQISPLGEWTIFQIFWSIVIVVERSVFAYFVAFISCWNSILWALVVMILSYFLVMITIVTLLATVRTISLLV
ncbi:hypothetical protein T492DRAFT_864844 [Pavlovales sp. CCMP2436]|nr:hypothetical protein T492DRAFT_864844 [Pavlovales sp. CCMP2436]